MLQSLINKMWLQIETRVPLYIKQLPEDPSLNANNGFAGGNGAFSAVCAP